MDDRKLRFGWFIPTFGDRTRLADPDAWIPPSFDEFLKVARIAEDAGFEYALVPVTPECWEAWITGAMLAASTERLKPLVAARPGYIAPTLMAKMISTLDQMSGGRCFVNLISTTTPADGLFYEHDERYELIDEQCEIMKRVWTEDEPVHYEGKHYRIEGAVVNPRPLQQPYPRFYIGGESEAGRNLSAKHTDVHLFWGDRPGDVAAKMEDIRERASRFGRDPDELEFGMRLGIVVRETEEEAWDAAWYLISSTHPEAEATRARLAQRLTTGDSVANRHQRVLARQSENEGYRIGPHLWTGINTVRGGAGTSVVGNPEQVAATLEEFVEQGVTEFCLPGYPHDLEAERFGRLVMPHFADRLAPPI